MTDNTQIIPEWKSCRNLMSECIVTREGSESKHSSGFCRGCSVLKRVEDMEKDRREYLNGVDP